MRTTRASLRILTNASSLRGFITALNEGLAECWCRNPLGSLPSKLCNQDSYWFTYIGDERGHVRLGLSVEHDGSLVDRDFFADFGQDGELTENDQSLFWKHLYVQAKPIAEAIGIEIILSHTPVDAEEILDSPEVTLLKRLRAVRSQDIDYLNSEDWHRFVAENHRKELPLSHDDLREWLVGDGWDGQVADDFAREYRLGRALLRHYDQNHRRNFL